MISSLFRLTAATTLCSSLTACYVVPIHSQTTPSQSTPTHSQPVAATTSARLYPTNDAASVMGVISGSIVNHLDGRGVFSFNLAGEQYQGEATRTGGQRSGFANATGNKGGYMSCTYALNNATQGVGKCTHSAGASFNMHIGQ